MTETITYFKKQEKIYPRRVWGRYRKLKWLAMVTLLGIYYLTPFLRWDRGPHAPDQAILIDMPARRGYFFGIEIWPQEVYLLVGILMLAAFGLFFATSLLGRVWCGYACPQTVWTDLFVWVERIVQGDRLTRMKLDNAPWSFNKLWRKLLTHSIWLVIGACTGGAWVLYFNDAPTVLQDIWHGTLGWGVGGWIVSLTLSTYIMAGYAREQVCTYMCPYARFQSAMFDTDTLIITYDRERGEPRGKHKAGSSWEGRGSCVDCDACTVVCPVGIDIRNGLQYQCISCGLCVDACNGIMEKLGQPKGLIRYDTERSQQARADAKACGKPLPAARLNIIRPRTMVYMVVLTLVSAVMLYTILHRSALDLSVIHQRNPLSVVLSDGRIRNHYTIKILNKTHEDRHYQLSISGVPNATLAVQGPGAAGADALPVLADSVGQYRVEVIAPADGPARTALVFSVRDTASTTEQPIEVDHDSFFVRN